MDDDALTDDQHRWASKFCGIKTAPDGAAGGDPGDAQNGAFKVGSDLGMPRDPAQDPSLMPGGGEATPEFAQALPAAGGVAVEAMIVAFLVLVAALVALAYLPKMSKEVEELLAKLQAAMATVAGGIKEAADWIEDQVKEHTRAGMICSDKLIAFRNLTTEVLAALAEPRDPDPVKQEQNVFRISNLVKKWQAAFEALLECLNANL